MARKRTIATAVMALPQALISAVQDTLPPELLETLTAQESLEVANACGEAAAEIAKIIDTKKGAANG